MKNSLLILFFIIISTNFSYSQLSLGGRLGSTFSTVVYDNDNLDAMLRPYMKVKVGTQLGLSGEYYFVPGLSVKSDIQYISKGFKYEFQFIEGKQRFDYLQAKVAGKVDFYNDDFFIFSAYAAPFTSYWFYGMKTETDYKTREIKKDNFHFSDSTYAYNRWDAGVAIGLELKIQQTRHRQIFFDIEYQHSLISNDIDKVDGKINRTLFLGVGWLYNF